MNTIEKQFIEQLISERKLSPGARDMEIADVIDQYNEVNVLDVDDPDFLVHPQVVPVMVLIDGEQTPGWSLTYAPHITSENPDIRILEREFKTSKQLTLDI